MKEINWKPDFRFTAFTMNMEVSCPDSACPYFTINKSKQNALSYLDVGEDLRAIALSGRIYDVGFRRTVSGKVIGARAAVLDQKDIHVWERRREPVAKGAGNYDLHYFRECLDSDGKECSVLLMYWGLHI